MADVPELIENLRQAINRGDIDGFLDYFTADGVVEDWGRRFAGRAAIRRWSDKELIGAKGTLTITRVVSVTAERVALETNWASSFFTGAGRFEFVLDGDKVREMRISEL